MRETYGEIIPLMIRSRRKNVRAQTHREVAEGRRKRERHTHANLVYQKEEFYLSTVLMR